jgi:hypothetical protein
MLIARFTARDPFRTSGIIEWPMPADIRSFEDLERFVPQAAGGAGLDPEKPLPFLATGARIYRIPYPQSPRRLSGQAMHKNTRLNSSWKTLRRRLSTWHRGVFMRAYSNIHLRSPDAGQR